MAVNTTIPVPSSAYMAMPLSIKRGNPNPLDTSDLYTSLADAQDYATNDPTAYVGQIISTVVTSVDPVSSETIYTVTMYQIVDTAGTLKECGTGIDDVFSDARFTAIKTAIETLQGDEDTSGSLKELQAMMTVTCSEVTEDGIKHWKFYQNYTLTPDPTDPSKSVKTPTMIADVKIDADVFISGGSVVEVIDYVIETPTYDFTTDTATYTSIDDVIAAHPEITPTDGDTLSAIINSVTEYYKYVADTTTWEKLPAYIDTEGDFPPSTVGVGTYMKLVLSSGDKLYIATEKIAKGFVKKITIDGTDFTPDTDGVVTISGISTDWLTQGTNTLVLNGGSSSI